ncbi:winged helix-turn-helix transcriptional regulator [Streptomyces acidicola]|uniref:winged helix-turn-helix transcriptional regulator n=1 Tax=Streptomyces acidicola TaxID=2596892 RepID=UPI00382B926A
MSLVTLENTMTDSLEPEVPPLIEALARAFALLGKPGNGLVLTALAKGPAGFAEVRKQVPGISDRMLAERIRELADAGLVVRTEHDAPPALPQYALTGHGNAFLFPLVSLGGVG